LLALLSAAVGFRQSASPSLMGNIAATGSSNADCEARYEFQRVVEAAQIWFLKPSSHGGGNYSFDALTFDAIGLATEPSSMEWASPQGRFRITGRRSGSFDLELTMPSGMRLVATGIAYDDLPKVELKQAVNEGIRE